jgi:curved DNA-binding protein CbpA
MSAPSSGKFQDHYVILDIDSNASNEVIQKAYSTLASKYNPRGGTVPDQAKFEAISLAYEVLIDPFTRTTFDSLRPNASQNTTPQFSGLPFFSAGEGETTRRRAVLCILYDRARQKPINPGLSMRHLEMMLTLTTEELQFAVWYLKARGLAASDDKSLVLITVAGMDYLDQNFPKPEEIMPLLRQPSQHQQ